MDIPCRQGKIPAEQTDFLFGKTDVSQGGLHPQFSDRLQPWPLLSEIVAVGAIKQQRACGERMIRQKCLVDIFLAEVTTIRSIGHEFRPTERIDLHGMEAAATFVDGALNPPSLRGGQEFGLGMKGVNRRRAYGSAGRIQEKGAVHPSGKGDGNLFVSG